MEYNLFDSDLSTAQLIHKETLSNRNADRFGEVLSYKSHENHQVTMRRLICTREKHPLYEHKRVFRTVDQLQTFSTFRSLGTHCSKNFTLPSTKHGTVLLVHASITIVSYLSLVQLTKSSSATCSVSDDGSDTDCNPCQ